MNTQTFKAYTVSSALIFTAFTSAILPATAASAASHRGDAPRHGYQKKQPIGLDEPTTQTEKVAETVAQPQAATVSATASPAPTQATKAQDPAGNNGFIKINEAVLSDGIPNNDPHVSCRFNVEFYNYDYNPSYRAHVTFALHNPTAGDDYSLKTQGNLQPVIGQDAAGGGNDLDAVETYKLTFTGKPHAQQGYHVKLTIHADGSRGADVKHKVFWVQPCQGHVLGSSDGGQIPATSTTREALPTTLPSTGSNHYGYAVTLLASALAYAFTLGAQKLRGFRLEA